MVQDDFRPRHWVNNAKVPRISTLGVTHYMTENGRMRKKGPRQIGKAEGWKPAKFEDSLKPAPRGRADFSVLEGKKRKLGPRDIDRSHPAGWKAAKFELSEPHDFLRRRPISIAGQDGQVRKSLHSVDRRQPIDAQYKLCDNGRLRKFGPRDVEREKSEDWTPAQFHRPRKKAKFSRRQAAGNQVLIPGESEPITLLPGETIVNGRIRKLGPAKIRKMTRQASSGWKPARYKDTPRRPTSTRAPPLFFSPTTRKSRTGPLVAEAGEVIRSGRVRKIGPRDIKRPTDWKPAPYEQAPREETPDPFLPLPGEAIRDGKIRKLGPRDIGKTSGWKPFKLPKKPPSQRSKSQGPNRLRRKKYTPKAAKAASVRSERSISNPPREEDSREPSVATNDANLTTLRSRLEQIKAGQPTETSVGSVTPPAPPTNEGALTSLRARLAKIYPTGKADVDQNDEDEKPSEPFVEEKAPSEKSPDVSEEEKASEPLEQACSEEAPEAEAQKSGNALIVDVDDASPKVAPEPVAENNTAEPEEEEANPQVASEPVLEKAPEEVSAPVVVEREASPEEPAPKVAVVYADVDFPGIYDPASAVCSSPTASRCDQKNSTRAATSPMEDSAKKSNDDALSALRARLAKHASNKPERTPESNEDALSKMRARLAQSTAKKADAGSNKEALSNLRARLAQYSSGGDAADKAESVATSCAPSTSAALDERNPSQSSSPKDDERDSKPPAAKTTKPAARPEEVSELLDDELEAYDDTDKGSKVESFNDPLTEKYGTWEVPGKYGEYQDYTLRAYYGWLHGRAEELLRKEEEAPLK